MKSSRAVCLWKHKIDLKNSYVHCTRALTHTLFSLVLKALDWWFFHKNILILARHFSFGEFLSAYSSCACASSTGVTRVRVYFRPEWEMVHLDRVACFTAKNDARFLPFADCSWLLLLSLPAILFCFFLFFFYFSVFLHNIRFSSFCSHRAACVRKSDCLRVVVIYVFRHHKVHCTHNRSSFNAAHHRQSFDVVTRLAFCLLLLLACLLASHSSSYFFFFYSSSVFFIRFLLFSLYLSHQNTRWKHEKCTLTEFHTEHCTGWFVCIL